jgi:hypothetical protein
MRHLIVLATFCILCAGCNGDGNNDPKVVRDPVPVYEAVLKEELKATKKGEGFYVFVDGKDPAPDLLNKFQKQWPDLQPGSKAPKGKANHVSIDGLKWIDANTAELRGGFSNGMDGRGSRYRVITKNTEWVIESVVLEVQS